jgi:hypothetical protein
MATTRLDQSLAQMLSANQQKTFRQGFPYGPGVFVGISIALRAVPGPHKLTLLGTQVETDAGGNSFLLYTLKNESNVDVEFFRTSVIVTGP